MGLPAFDMSAFEAAHNAVTSKPRTTTTVFVGSRLKSSASIDEWRDQARASTDDIIVDYESWRADVLRGMAEMPTLIENACRSQSLDQLRSLSVRLSDLLEKVEAIRQVSAAEDEELIRSAFPLAERASQISADDGRFIRREIKRVEQMARARKATYEKILASTGEAKTQLDLFISSQVVGSISSLEGHKTIEYMHNALQRPSDIKGVKERTARRLKQFPKTAAYLAR